MHGRSMSFTPAQQHQVKFPISFVNQITRVPVSIELGIFLPFLGIRLVSLHKWLDQLNVDIFTVKHMVQVGLQILQRSYHRIRFQLAIPLNMPTFSYRRDIHIWRDELRFKKSCKKIRRCRLAVSAAHKFSQMCFGKQSRKVFTLQSRVHLLFPLSFLSQCGCTHVLLASKKGID